MPVTNIPYGHPMAAKVFGAAVFAGVQAQKNFMNLLSGPAPKINNAAAKMKGQTEAGMPIVKATDLSRTAGDSLSIDLFNILKGKPVMGDERVAGRGMSTTTSSMDVKIDLSRGMSDTGGRMNQKRTVHNLRTIIQAGLENWAGRLEDQRILVHLAGSRGNQNFQDWVIPQQSDPDFGKVMVNGVKAPTHNRRFVASLTGSDGGISTASSMTVNHYISLSEIGTLGAMLKESHIPLQPIKIKGDNYGWNDPFWVLFVTERQWELLKAVSQAAWRSATENAYKRQDAMGMKHPLFMGDCIMWNGILVKPLGRYAVRFAAGDNIVENNSSNTEGDVTAAVATDRAILLGAQAVIKAYGNEKTSDYHYSWNEELTDHKSVVEVSLSMMEGTSKVRFDIDGVATDHGVAVLDSYAPALGSAAFNTAAANPANKPI